MLPYCNSSAFGFTVTLNLLFKQAVVDNNCGLLYYVYKEIQEKGIDIWMQL